MPGFLINIVFAGLFLGTAPTSLKKIWHLAAPQFCFGQIIAWGQYVVGLGLVFFLLAPVFNVPDVFGNLLEIGFEGGHGTVGGLAETFRELGWQAGADLGYTVATCGMILGIVIGMILINIAVRRGYVRDVRTFDDRETLERIGFFRREKQPLAGKQTVSPDSVDSLALHIALVGIAILIGYGIKQLLILTDGMTPASFRELHIMQSLPLFPLCMIGGVLLQLFLRKTRLDMLADHGQMKRITGAALDFLVVAAIASIRLEFVIAYWAPLSLLVLAGIVWNVFAVMYIGPRIFENAWFERSIAEFGQAMGVTATGLMLLRTVDPKSKTVAMEAFGYKQLLHEPVMGGGFWTSLAVPLVMLGKGMMIWFVSIAILVIASVCWLRFFNTKKNLKS
ncbi:sodium:glutamate symporter [Oxalobacter aliiformigenes]|uniref:sodium/glutamate symporter n=1 Tax=Oxalobacter aliiformigenes TaxID=2946593 RepID=UPI0022AFEFFE|nr:sodium:glutamate symporter [Oxalobacter aliiformigenes]WAV89076.1 sodium:glutamate symporter [Oxalobacter aliiformigenes]